ncbi:MbcA/ParS/Xre antitoxin family protein [Algiphilus sp.]|uniref:MbcA/ParS/Xre antitoxin family protein n=1 Tax=Algiphilus sp. TaxID=1872431 RepID=UPI002A5EE57D|nr:MbcA/ParS/Xre antitoxin family protein [Pseudomonadota bacterium]
MSAKSASSAAEAGHRVSRQEASVAIKAALRIAACWQLSDRDLGILLGGISVASLRRWRSALRDGGTPRADINVDTLDRVSYLLGIYKSLHLLFPDAAQADAWIHKPNDGLPFGGRSAMDVMLQGSMRDLMTVRRYLDAWRG